MICTGNSELRTRQPSTAHTKSHAHQSEVAGNALFQVAHADGAAHSQAGVSECSPQHNTTQHRAANGAHSTSLGNFQGPQLADDTYRQRVSPVTNFFQILDAGEAVNVFDVVVF